MGRDVQGTRYYLEMNISVGSESKDLLKGPTGETDVSKRSDKKVLVQVQEVKVDLPFTDSSPFLSGN